MKKRVLILANHSVGLYNFRRDLIKKLQDNYEVYISVPNNGFWNELESMGWHLFKTSIDRRGVNPIKDMGLLKQYSKIIKKVHPQLVITYTIKPNIYGGILCRVKKIPYTANITGLGTTFQRPGIMRKLVTLLYKVSLKRSEVCFFENDENRRIFINEKILTENQTCLLNGAGVNLHHFALANYPEENERIRFLFSGRVMKEKGVEELFCAMQKLRKDGLNCFLDIIGEYEEDYAGCIEDYHKEGWLKYHGYQEDVRPFIERCHCFVLPSYHEGMANTLLEAAAMGRPLISSNIYGCKEAIAEYRNGFLVKKADSDDLYRKMKQFIGLSLIEKQKMGLASREHMEQSFDKKKVVERTIKALQEFNH